MPRFGLTDNAESSTAASFRSNKKPVTYASPGIRRPTSSSVRWCCSSSDGRCFHALNIRDLVIETHRLPLDQTREGVPNIDLSNDLPVKLIRTNLPDEVVAALELDAPLELLCVNDDTTNDTPSELLVHLSQLCLYTRKSAFLMQIAYRTDYVQRNVEVIKGEILSVTEPFESFLMGMSFSNQIVRIRSAPRKVTGYAFLVASGSMAMLTNNNETRERSLTLYHGADKEVTTPFVSSDGEEDDPDDCIVDFCFVSSRGLNVFASMSILLLKANGDVMSASPFIFRGSVVPRSELDEALDYISDEIESMERSTAHWRQLRAAQQYLVDVFPIVDRRNHFCTAQVGSNSMPSVSWPIQLQGPVIVKSENEIVAPSLAIEAFGCYMLVSIAISRDAEHVDFALISPCVLLPRFSFESQNDSYDLDGEVCKQSSIIQRVSLGQQQQDQQRSGRTCSHSVLLLANPVVNTLLHVATSKMIATITTNAARVMSCQLMGEPDAGKIRTNAWCCLNVATTSSNSAVRGAVVSGDIMTEHEIVAHLEDGTNIPVSLNEAQYLLEMNEASHELISTKSPTTKNEFDSTLLKMQAVSPLHEVVEPIIGQIKDGLSRMGKIVGTETNYTDITPDILAVAIKLKERCDKEVVLPLLELKKAVEKREQSLVEMLKSQQQQLSKLLETVDTLRKRMSALDETMSTVELNSAILSESSARLYQASQDLCPTITEKEYEFFNDVKQMEMKSKVLEDQEIKERIEIEQKLKNEWAGGASVPIVLSPAEVRNANALLNASGGMIKTTRQRLDKMDQSLKKILMPSEQNVENALIFLQKK